MSTRLDSINEDITLIVEREITKYKNKTNLDINETKAVESLNKILTILLDRDQGKVEDTFKSTSSEDLLKDFE